jgi:prevent-host-death family protein
MRFNIHEAKTQFSKLVAAVERGETVTICRNGAPVIDCVPARPAGPFPFGGWADLASGPGAPGSLDHMAAPTDAEDLDAMGL